MSAHAECPPGHLALAHNAPRTFRPSANCQPPPPPPVQNVPHTRRAGQNAGGSDGKKVKYKREQYGSEPFAGGHYKADNSAQL